MSVRARGHAAQFFNTVPDFGFVAFGEECGVGGFARSAAAAWFVVHGCCSFGAGNQGHGFFRSMGALVSLIAARYLCIRHLTAFSSIMRSRFSSIVDLSWIGMDVTNLGRGLSPGRFVQPKTDPYTCVLRVAGYVNVLQNRQ